MESNTPKPVSDERPKATLFDFVKDNSTLITGVAAFAALTAFFTTQLKDAEIQATLPGVTLLGAFLLGFELLTRTPAPPRHWRLAVFELVLMVMLANLAWYWFKAFHSIWVPLLGFLANLVLLFALPTLLTYPCGKAVKFVAVHALHKQIADVTLIPIQRVIFVLLVIGDTVLYFWAAHKLIPHPITIRTPF